MYTELLAKSKEVSILLSIRDIIGWDFQTYMPTKAVQLRGEQNAFIEGLRTRMRSDPETGELLDRIENDPNYSNLSIIEKRNIFLIRKLYNRAVKTPVDLMMELIRQRTITTSRWKEAKEKKDFSLIQDDLEKLFVLTKKYAEILAEVLEIPVENKYDALLDFYEPGMNSAKVSKLFDELKEGLIPLIKKCTESSKQPDTTAIDRNVPVNKQKEIASKLMEFIQYDLDRGRLDETEHPFTIGYYDDVRITTHYYVDKPSSAIFSTLHEGGHALYEQNLNREWMYQPIGAYCSLGFHESQSRFVENIIGRSREFWEYFLPVLKNLTGDIYTDVSVDDIFPAVNAVKPSKIRIEADEVTYALHVIIRFEIERDLIAGKTNVTDLPKIWNDKYKEYLGIDVENDTEGVLQDTHWYGGSAGYFPTYVLGNIIGSQIVHVMEKEIPDWKDLVAKGEFTGIKKWMVDNVHNHGNIMDSLDLVQKVTGEEINVKYFLKYLNDKYSRIYGF